MRQTQGLPIPVVFPAFPGATVTLMVRSTVLESTVSGGVPVSLTLRTHGSAAWATTMPLYTGATTIRQAVSPCVLSGINCLFAYLSIWGLGRSPKKFSKKMSQYQDLPVYKSSYDLLLGIFQCSKGFNREYKYTIGETLKKESIELLMLIFRANSRQEKAIVLKEAKERVESIRLLIRIMKDLHQINLSGFVQISQKIEEVSRQLTGWQRAQK
jgi:hypothetical protein